MICIIKLITKRTFVSGWLSPRAGGPEEGAYLASSLVMSVRLQDQPSCLRRRSRRRDRADDRGVHEVALRDQDVENERGAWRSPMSYGAPFCLRTTDPGNYDHPHFLTVPWARVGERTGPRRGAGPCSIPVRDTGIFLGN